MSSNGEEEYYSVDSDEVSANLSKYRIKTPVEKLSSQFSTLNISRDEETFTTTKTRTPVEAEVSRIRDFVIFISFDYFL